MKGRDNPGTPEPRQAQSLLGEATAESGASGRLDCPSPGESGAAQSRFRIGVGQVKGVANPRNASSIKRGAETAVGR